MWVGLVLHVEDLLTHLPILQKLKVGEDLGIFLDLHHRDPDVVVLELDVEVLVQEELVVPEVHLDTGVNTLTEPTIVDVLPDLGVLVRCSLGKPGEEALLGRSFLDFVEFLEGGVGHFGEWDVVGLVIQSLFMAVDGLGVE